MFEYLYIKLSWLFSTPISSTIIISIITFAVLIYWAFFSDAIRDKNNKKKKKEVDIENIKKISLIKMVSDDKKEIENFITTNVEILPNDIIVKLVERIEVIKS